MVDIPAISGVDDQANVRVVLLQGKQQVNAPLTALGFGTMANQNADSVNITGGAIKGISPFIVGHTAQLAIANTDNVQIIGTTVPAVGLGMLSFVNGGQPHVDFYSSPSGAIGTYAPVINGGALGALNWYGAQQTGTAANWNRAAQIRAEVDGVVTDGAGADMPGRIIFSTSPDGSGTIVERMRIASNGLATFANDVTVSGTLTAGVGLAISTGAIVTGTWTPTLTNVANLAASTASAGHYIRVGNKVMCFVAMDLDPNLSAPTITQVGITIPIASNFTAVTDLSGAGGSASGVNSPATIVADTTNDRATYTFVAGSGANLPHTMTFGYTIQ